VFGILAAACASSPEEARPTLPDVSLPVSAAGAEGVTPAPFVDLVLPEAGDPVTRGEGATVAIDGKRLWVAVCPALETRAQAPDAVAVAIDVLRGTLQGPTRTRVHWRIPPDTPTAPLAPGPRGFTIDGQPGNVAQLSTLLDGAEAAGLARDVRIEAPSTARWGDLLAVADVASEAGAARVFLPSCGPETEAEGPLGPHTRRRDLVLVENRPVASQPAWLQEAAIHNLVQCGDAAYVAAERGQMYRVTQTAIESTPVRGQRGHPRRLGQACGPEGTFAMVSTLGSPEGRPRHEPVELTLWGGGPSLTRIRWDAPRDSHIGGFEVGPDGAIAMAYSVGSVREHGVFQVREDGRLGPHWRVFQGDATRSVTDVTWADGALLVATRQLMGQSGPFHYGIRTLLPDGAVVTPPGWEGRADGIDGRFVDGTAVVHEDGFSVVWWGPSGVLWLEEDRVAHRRDLGPRSSFSDAILVGDGLWVSGMTLELESAAGHGRARGWVGTLDSASASLQRVTVQGDSVVRVGALAELGGRPVVGVSIEPSYVDASGDLQEVPNASASAGAVVFDRPGSWVWFSEAPLPSH